MDSFSQYDNADWQNPLILGVSKLPPRFSSWPCPDAASGWKSTYDASPWVKPLNGQWLFHWSPDPTRRPKGFFSPAFDASTWRPIPVPSCWELEGFKIPPLGQPNYGIPIYSNYDYPFSVNRPGHVMDTPPEHFTSFTQRNPVGCYRTTFEVPADWLAGRILLHFAGVSSAMYLWVNGHKIGYSQDSRSPAEFDITPYIQPGSNLLAVEVYRWCAGSYLEDQDMWRLSGIFRDVFLYHTPPVTLWDACLDARLDPAMQSATLSLQCTLRTAAAAAGPLRLRLSLRDPSGDLVGAGPLLDEGVILSGSNEYAQHQTATVTLSHPLLWTHEMPSLYDALIELVAEGRVIETRRLDLGFRTVELRDQQYWLNGKSLKIRGVNRHEVSPGGGYTLTRQHMEADLALVKQANINFVRASHYPNDPRWYELCNRWGMLIVDEANVESHGLSYHKKVLPGDDPTWEPAIVDRMRRLVVRDRNHPCVVMWSLGNEAGYGKTFFAMRQATLDLDPQHRPIQYADMNMVADMDTQTYPTTDWLLEHVTGKAIRKGERGEIGVTEQHGPYPSGRGFFCNEYAHAQANSLGNLQDYWDVFERFPMLWGGFIWEWVDQTLYKTNTEGEPFPAYGGDFGDQPNNGRFCVKGLVNAERKPWPHYWEAKKVHQYIKVTALDLAAGRVRIRNKYSFTALSEFAADWVLEENGRPLAQGPLGSLSTAPGEEQEATIPWGAPVFQPGVEYFVTIRFRLTADTPWAKAGHIVAWDQLALPAIPTHLAPAAPAATSVTLRQCDRLWVAQAGPVRICVDAACGQLTSLVRDAHEYLAAPLVPSFWRIPTDNDLGWKGLELMRPWETALRDATLESLDAQITPQGAAIAAHLKLPIAGAAAKLTYTLHGDGSLNIRLILELPEGAPELPRIGVQFAIPAACSNIRWFGRGPHENYRDRKTAADVRVHESTAQEWITPYPRPQENANRTDIRWAEFTAADARGIRIATPTRPLGISAWPYTLEDLGAATHNHQLPRRDVLTVNVDGFQIGVGGDTSWGAPIHEEYRLLEKGRYDFAFDLSTIP